MWQRLSVAAMLAVATFLGSGGGAALGQNQPADPRFFSQTNFRIDTDAFWDFFQGRGGVRTFGYPVSRTFKLDGFQVQIFQRLIMQLQPDGSVQTLNLLDQGLMPYTRINGSTFPAPDPAVIAATPPVSSPTYATDITEFVRAQAPDTFDGQPVNFGDDVFQHGDASRRTRCRSGAAARLQPADLGRADQPAGLRSVEP